MEREIIKIDENLCNGCGNCVPKCHEGALQIIDGKARLVSELMCDGLGACIGHCPEGAITVETREATPYDEVATIKSMINSGENTIVAHLQHMIDHNEMEYYNQGMNYLIDNERNLPFKLNNVLERLKTRKSSDNCSALGACPGSATKSFMSISENDNSNRKQKSELTHWPIQLHLINPSASHFKNSELLIAADCTAFSMGNFHSDFLKGKTMVIACPKLDHSTDVYIEKFRALIAESKVNTISLLMMEVPCCHSLVPMIQKAIEKAGRKVPVKAIIVDVQGNILQDEWI
ncbi:MAG TPA: 4Fe-4S binding protein [Bacteroidales bacterium]|nr:4Fe-4S binding protein [Bacteroidales bacterium]